MSQPAQKDMVWTLFLLLEDYLTVIVVGLCNYLSLIKWKRTELNIEDAAYYKDILCDVLFTIEFFCYVVHIVRVE